MKYYLLKNGDIAAVSSRGIFILADKEWYPTFGSITEVDLNAGEQITEEQLDRLLAKQRAKEARTKRSIFVDRISTGATEIDLSINGAMYLSRIPVIKALLDGQMININSPVTFFVGDNGTGKSTLLEESQLLLATMQKAVERTLILKPEIHILVFMEYYVFLEYDHRRMGSFYEQRAFIIWRAMLMI